MTSPLFGTFILDRDPVGLANLPGLVQAWFMDAGGFAFVGLLVYLLYATRVAADRSDRSAADDRAPVSTFMLVMWVLALFAYAIFGFLLYTNKGVDQLNTRAYVSDPGSYQKYIPPKLSFDLQPLALSLAGAFAVAGISQPFVAGLLKLRSRRLWALAKLGFKEAVRSRLLWVFLFFLVPFLFPISWFLPLKPEDELRTAIGVSTGVTQFLLFASALLLSAFAIPNDIKNQNIYTIVTKPVERFEIVLGRFLGYAALMTVALVGMVAVGVLLIVNTKLDPKAIAETYKVRDPVRGQLSFASRKGQIEGTNVGREFDYRRYIGGDPGTSQRAVYAFDRLPSAVTAAGRDVVPVEFTFDIFRMTKGDENRGVDITVRVCAHQCGQAPPTEPNDGTWKWVDPAMKAEYDQYAKELAKEFGPAAEQNPAAYLAAARPGTPEWAAVSKLAEKFGYFEVQGKEIFDYHPDQIAVPAGLFRLAAQGTPPAVELAGPPGAGGPAVVSIAPRVQVYVKCNTRGQLLGMAEPDLYLLANAGESSDVGFAANYLKASFGVWCLVMIVLGLAVCVSTYLEGVIALLAAVFLFLSGFFAPHIVDQASGASYAGGPLRAMNSLLQAKSTIGVSDDTPTERAAGAGDSVFSWIVRRYINLIPDVDAFDWTKYLSEGFNVPVEYLAMNLLLLVGYLLPWFVLGYYLMRSREVAA